MKNKRNAFMAKARHLGENAPSVVALIALHSSVNLPAAFKLILSAMGWDDNAIAARFDDKNSSPNVITTTFPNSKRKVSFVMSPTRDVFTLLDITKVAGIALLVVPGDGSEFDEMGSRFLSILRAQGLPTVLGAIQGLASVPVKKRNPIRKKMSDDLEFECPNSNVRTLPLDTLTDAQQCVRFLSAANDHESSWRSLHSHLLVERYEFSQSSGGFQDLRVYGYVRGRNMIATHLIHVPGAGDFSITQIEQLADPFATAHQRKAHDDMDAEIQEALVRAVPSQPTPLEAENAPDLLANEQTWPTADDFPEGEEEAQNISNVKKRTDEYDEFRKAWVDEDDEEAEGDDGDDDKEEADEDEEGNQEMADAAHPDAAMEALEGGVGDQVSVADEGMSDDENMTPEQQANHRKQLMKSDQNDDIHFPDEVETPHTIPARQRFARYRGLRSFRTSPWDPKENLPIDYSRTTAFSNFRRTLKRVTAIDGDTTEDTPIQVGMFVAITITRVPDSAREFISRIFLKSCLTVSTLLQYEQRLGVIHFRLQRHQDYEDPIRSKQLLIVHTGFRTFLSRMTFSEDSSRVDKFKMERFFHFHRTVIGSTYGPVTFPPTPTLVFTVPESCMSGYLSALVDKNSNTSLFSQHAANPSSFQPLSLSISAQPTLCATGTCLGVDPDRVVVKKIVLSGFPLKVRKRYAVVRYMFFNPEDVRWFRPVDLWTKRGRKGNIREPVGTHGSYKAVFDGQIYSNDVVCMSLYKRAFPKYMPITYTTLTM
eukprot:c9960_g1_i1.p1 GENE.c9960_g1_i1~~c9960_g1_i1.p1  ORF type:complete len:843 (+),score=227.39 c9960_g1_i1:233-2530(+)